MSPSSSAWISAAFSIVVVMPPGRRVPFRVLIDGEPPGTDRALDVDEQRRGTVAQQLLYQLNRQRGSITDRTFAITFLAHRVETYVFTFG
jgi:Thioredoxin like C-terminal domain